MIDHRTLLAKYISLVSECEDRGFIDRLKNKGTRGFGRRHLFSEDDVEELEHLRIVGKKVADQALIRARDAAMERAIPAHLRLHMRD